MSLGANVNTKKMNQIRKESIEFARARMKDNTHNIDYEGSSYENFYSLRQIKDELNIFQRDLNEFYSNENKVIVYAIDDVLLDAYSVMDDGARHSFHFNLPVEGEDENDVLKQRAAEYLFRLESLLFESDRSVFLLPPNALNVTNDLTYFSTPEATSKIDKLENDVEYIKASSLPKIEEGRGGQYRDVVRGGLSNESRDLLVNLRGGLYPKASIKKLDIITEYSRAEENASVSTMAEKSLKDKNKKNLAKLNALDRYKKTLSNCSKIKFLQEFNIGEFLPEWEGEDKFNEEVQELLSPDGFAKYSEITKVLFEFQYDLEKKEKVFTHRSRNLDLLHRTSEVATFVHALNVLFAKYDLPIQMQFVTHRALLPMVTRMFPEDQLLVPIRHPKLLAGTMSKDLRGIVYPYVERINASLDSFIRQKLDLRRVSGHDLKEISKRISPSWTALKHKVFSSQAGYEAKKYLDEVDVLEKPELYALKLVAQHNDSKSLPAQLVLKELVQKSDILFREFYNRSLEGINLRAIFVPARKKEDAHWLVFSKEGKFRYVFKVQSQVIGMDAPKGNGVCRLPLSSMLSSKNVREFPDRAIFASTMASMIAGNWSIVRSYLNNDRLESITCPDLKNECLFMKHLALRGMASQKRRNKQQSGRFLEKAMNIIGALRKAKPNDLRFVLGYAATLLECIVSADGEAAFVNKDAYGVNGSLLLSILECIDGLLSNIKRNISNLEKNQLSEGQALYWFYMEARCLQILFTTFMVVWIGKSENPAVDQYRLVYDPKTKIEWLDALERYNKAWESYAYGWRKLVLRKKKGKIKDIFEGYHAARFCNNFGKLAFSYEFGEILPDYEDATNSMNLRNISNEIGDVFKSLSEMEESCLKLSFSGLPRQVFRTVKKKAYQSTHRNLQDTSERVFADLVGELDKTSSY